MIPIWAILLIALIILIIWIIWEYVITPNIVLTVATDKASYAGGETVQGSGLLTGDGTPIAGEDIAGAIILPGGASSVDFTATTDVDGKYTFTYAIPTAGPPGTYTVQVAGFGASASTTFTQVIQMKVSVLAM